MCSEGEALFAPGMGHDNQTTNRTRLVNRPVLEIGSHVVLNECHWLVVHFLVCALLHRVLHVLLQQVVEKRDRVQSLPTMKRMVNPYSSRSSLRSFILVLSSSIFCIISLTFFYASLRNASATSWRDSSASITGLLSISSHSTSKRTRFRLLLQIRDLLLLRVQLLLVLRHEALVNNQHRHIVRVRVVSTHHPITPFPRHDFLNAVLQRVEKHLSVLFLRVKAVYA